MILVPGGRFAMGSRHHYQEEAPVREVDVPDVWFDPHPVTNRRFAAFVADTGHVTVAERAPSAADFPDADPALLVPGSQVFTQTDGPVPLDDWTRWWRWQPGADWRHPQGPDSGIGDLADHPVVHVGWEDARAYAAWAGASLPTEAEWEHAARGGLSGAEFAWGDALHPDGRVMANTWAGRFPYESTARDGFHRTSPVGSYPPNGYGLYDMIGNVWEWTASPWTPSHAAPAGATLLPVAGQEVPACCGGAGHHVDESDRFVTKGGSHLCSPDYCRRYRPAARQGHGVRDTTSHVGFRCVRRA